MNKVIWHFILKKTVGHKPMSCGRSSRVTLTFSTTKESGPEINGLKYSETKQPALPMRLLVALPTLQEPPKLTENGYQTKLTKMPTPPMGIGVQVYR